MTGFCCLFPALAPYPSQGNLLSLRGKRLDETFWRGPTSSNLYRPTFASDYTLSPGPIFARDKSNEKARKKKSQPPTCLHPPRSRGHPTPSLSKRQSTNHSSQQSTRTSSFTPAPSLNLSKSPPIKSLRPQTACKSTARTVPSSPPRSPLPPLPARKSARSASHHTV